MRDRVQHGSFLSPLRRSAAFDYTAHLDRVVHHVTQRCPSLSYVDPGKIVTAWSQSRVGGEHGIYATIHALRFEGGSQTMIRGKHSYRWPRITFEGKEVLYVVYFMLPRFADLSLRSKLTTIFHELYHVNPQCNGDLRRFPGRNYAHGHSRQAYNARLQPWIDHYLEHPETAEVVSFLQHDFRKLCQDHQAVTGRRIQPLSPVRAQARP